METVEVYLQEEVKELVLEPAKLDEWNKIVSELELQGQQSLTTEEKSPVPFPFMNAAMTNTYKVLCPCNNTIKEYNKSTIPLRVLSALALCKQEKYFHKIEIWYADTKPDPIAVGFLDSGYSSNKYIIARWGDELCSFQELQQRAIKAMKEEVEPRLRRCVNEAKQQLDNIDELVQMHMNGDHQYFKS